MKRSKKIPLPKKQQIPLIVITALVVITLLGLLVAVFQRTAPAGTGNLYVTERSVSKEANQEVTYTVRINPITTVDTVTATLSYDPNDLTFKSVDYKDSPFTVQVPAIKEKSSVTIQAAQFNGAIKKDSLFARVTFQATRSGNHSVTLSAGNAAHAGVATYPALNGKTQYAEETSTSKEPSQSPNPVIRAGELSLRMAGASQAAAQRGAAWFIALVVCLVAAIPIILLYIRSQKTKPSSKQPHDVVHSDHKDI